jgi:hypothetical protein
MVMVKQVRVAECMVYFLVAHPVDEHQIVFAVSPFVPITMRLGNEMVLVYRGAFYHFPTADWTNSHSYSNIQMNLSEWYTIMYQLSSARHHHQYHPVGEVMQELVDS